MAEKITYADHDQYIAAFSESVQEKLAAVRSIVHEVVPGVEEVISYGIPAFKKHGWIIYLSAYKEHFTISCPPPFTVFEVFKKELAAYKYSKSAIQIPYDIPLPLQFITELVRFRAKEAEEIAKSKLK